MHIDVVVVVVSHSLMSNSLKTHAIAHQSPLSTDFSRQEYWSGLSYPLQEISILIIILNVNGLNVLSKRQTGWADENMCMYALPLPTPLCLSPQIISSYFILLS